MENSKKVWKIISAIVVWVTLIAGLVVLFAMHENLWGALVMLLGMVVSGVIDKITGGDPVDRVSASAAAAQNPRQGAPAQPVPAPAQSAQTPVWQIATWIASGAFIIVGIVLLCMHLSGAAAVVLAIGFAIYAVASLIEAVRG